MKVNESFAVEATEEVRKDPRFEWYVNWIFTISKKAIPISSYYSHPFIGLSTKGIVTNYTTKYNFDKIITLDEVYSRYGKEIYEANGIEQPKDRYVLDVVNPNDIPYRNTCVIRIGSDFTPEEVKIMEDALNKQQFQGSREYDEKLLEELQNFLTQQGQVKMFQYTLNKFLNNRYPNESILKQIAEHKAKIEELEKQLR